MFPGISVFFRPNAKIFNYSDNGPTVRNVCFCYRLTVLGVCGGLEARVLSSCRTMALRERRSALTQRRRRRPRGRRELPSVYTKHTPQRPTHPQRMGRYANGTLNNGPIIPALFVCSSCASGRLKQILPDLSNNSLFLSVPIRLTNQFRIREFYDSFYPVLRMKFASGFQPVKKRYAFILEST